MARPSSADQSNPKPRARNARPKIERAALKLFIHEGIDAATTREIAEKVGHWRRQVTDLYLNRVKVGAELKWRWWEGQGGGGSW